MNNQITLMRKVEGEFAPQYWTMTGKEFDAMLNAVKALPFRQWQASEKAWLVRMEGIKALREAGYTIDRESDVRVELYNGQQSITKHDTSADVEIILNYRRADGEWAVVSTVRPHFVKTVHLDFAPEAIDEIAQQVIADEITQRTISEKNRASYGHDTAILNLTIRKVHELSAEAQACYKENRKMRTADDHKAAVQAAWNLIEGK